MHGQRIPGQPFPPPVGTTTVPPGAARGAILVHDHAGGLAVVPALCTLHWSLEYFAPPFGTEALVLPMN